MNENATANENENASWSVNERGNWNANGRGNQHWSERVKELGYVWGSGPALAAVVVMVCARDFSLKDLEVLSPP